MDIITKAVCEKIAEGAVSGVESMSIDDYTLVINCVDGTVLRMEFPVPKDGVSITDVEVNNNKHIICTMSDGTTIDAGAIPAIKGDKGNKGDKGDTGVGMPAGGTTGQFVVKKSNTDYDFDWKSLGTASEKDHTTFVSPDNEDIPTSAAVYRAMSAMLSGAFHPAGEKTVAQLTSALLIEENLGNVYLITDSGVTDDNWFGGADQPIVAGNMAVVNFAGNNTYKFMLQPGISIDLSSYQEKTLSESISVDGVTKNTVEDALEAINDLAAGNKTAVQGKQDTMQYATMPAANASNVGRIVQYIGNGSGYVNGYFYKCVENSESYSWELHNVQQGGSGGGGYTAGDGINISAEDVISTNNLQNGDMDDIVTPLPSVRGKYHKYSTEEQIIGEWIDGKPVYEKVLIPTEDITITTNWTAIHNVSDLNIETLVFAQLHRYRTQGTESVGIDVNTQTGMLEARFPYGSEAYWVSGAAGFTIIQYTKTTD